MARNAAQLLADVIAGVLTTSCQTSCWYDVLLPAYSLPCPLVLLYGCLPLSPCPSSQVAVGASTSKFSSAVVDDRIEVAGSVKSGAPFLTRVGAYDVDLALEVGI